MNKCRSAETKGILLDKKDKHLLTTSLYAHTHFINSFAAPPRMGSG